MAYAAAILTMRGKDELLVVIWGGVYCPVDFLLLLETDHFIPELCPFLVLPSDTSFTPGISKCSSVLPSSFSMLVSLPVARVNLIAVATFVGGVSV